MRSLPRTSAMKRKPFAALIRFYCDSSEKSPMSTAASWTYCFDRLPFIIQLT